MSTWLEVTGNLAVNLKFETWFHAEKMLELVSMFLLTNRETWCKLNK